MMIRLNVSVRNAALNLTGDYMFEWKWYLKDLKQDKDVNVFSCFSCGGGSSMGYKRAGFNVLGNVEIDPAIIEVYRKNLKPKYSYNMDLRDFNKKEDLPEELYNLDILDGSPPCSTFSTAGQREKNWGKEKKFREGQKKQVLDDLFFVFLDTVEKLKPKIVIAENVTGLIKGNAKGYVNEIIKRFHALGYKVQLFQLNAAKMNVPQARERVFFIANSQGYKPLKLSFNEDLITFGEVRSAKGVSFSKESAPKMYYYLQNMKPTDRSVKDIKLRLYNKGSNYNNLILQDHYVAQTLLSGGEAYRAYDRMRLSDDDCRNISTFPQDYVFGDQKAQYVCGMSVPPNMMANIATEIYRQWLY